MIWIEDNRSYRIKTQLMWLDIPIANFIINFSSYSVDICEIDVIDNTILPFVVQQNTVGLFDWMLSRCLVMRSHRNIFFANLPTSTETRDFRLPFVLSLATNCTSLSDKYWLNPRSTTEFVCNGAKIIFERKTWDKIDPFKNLYIPGVLEHHGLNDTFFIEMPENIDARSLVWSTNGCQNKRWMLDESGYLLEKKLFKDAFNNEVATLDFFMLNGIVVPQYDYYIKELDFESEECNAIFLSDTIKEGLHVIQKRCLTDSNSYLLRLTDYIDGDSDIVAPIERMCRHNNVRESEIKQFIETIKKYQEKFDVEDSLIDTRNIGLFVDEERALPIIWGRLKMKRNWVGQIDE